jgi:GH24 family phage-related lysozyme (muramidase)
MLLKQGDSGEGVRSLQRGLNKLGSILLVDGRFGPGTRDSVIDCRVALRQPGPPEADDALQQALAALPDPFPPLTPAGVTFIARAEVSGPREYRMKYKNPVWPSAESGVTIGIGYDLRFADSDRLNADWKSQLPPAAITRTLDQTRSIYPQVQDLAPARRTALVSLVYNRGARLQDKDPARQERREMRAIRDLLAAARFDEAADQLDAMSRLWDPAKLPGLVQRRHDEAKLWRSGFSALQLD